MENADGSTSSASDSSGVAPNPSNIDLRASLQQFDAAWVAKSKLKEQLDAVEGQLKTNTHTIQRSVLKEQLKAAVEQLKDVQEPLITWLLANDKKSFDGRTADGHEWTISLRSRKSRKARRVDKKHATEQLTTVFQKWQGEGRLDPAASVDDIRGRAVECTNTIWSASTTDSGADADTDSDASITEVTHWLEKRESTRRKRTKTIDDRDATN